MVFDLSDLAAEGEEGGVLDADELVFRTDAPVHLFGDHARLDGLNRADPVGILRGDAGDGGGAEHAVRPESFQVGLNPRPAAAVGPGHRQRDRHHKRSLHSCVETTNSRGRRKARITTWRGRRD
jgi:hypothetical protein